MAENPLETEQMLFLGLLQSFVSNAWIQMGKRENPVTGKTAVNLDEAKFTIDMLEMLEKKTQGNLSDNEQQIMSSALTELKMSFVNLKLQHSPDNKSENE